MGSGSSKFSDIIRDNFTFIEGINSPIGDIKVYENNERSDE